MLIETLDTSANGRFGSKVSAIGLDLSRTFRDVLAAVPGSPHRPQQLADRLGINLVLSSRILKATRLRDPVTIAHSIPGPEPLRRLLRAAAELQVDPALLRQATEVVDRFEELIHTDAGDRASLDSILSDWLPDARARVERQSKQAIYRGFSHLLGMALDTQVIASVFWPNADGKTLDHLWLSRMQGLRRTRSGTRLCFEIQQSRKPGYPLLTLEGRPAHELRGLLLEPYCSTPLPRMKYEVRDDTTIFIIDEPGVGPKSAFDITYAIVRRGVGTRFQTKDNPPFRTGSLTLITQPQRAQIFDVLLHEDVYTGSTPQLDVYKTDVRGVADPNDASRECDRLAMSESIQELGQGFEALNFSIAPQYPEIMLEAYTRLEWDVNKLRGYRLHLEYPPYCVQYSISFQPPIAEA